MSTPDRALLDSLVKLRFLGKEEARRAEESAGERLSIERVLLEYLKLTPFALDAARNELSADRRRENTTLQPGQPFGKYEILSRLGSGGLADVYRARDAETARDVALKVLRPVEARREGTIRRFAEEARALAEFNHSGIAAIHDLGIEEGLYYCALDFIGGPDLAAFCTPDVSLERRLTLFMRLVEAVAHIHASGAIHRDLKPSNVLVDAGDRPVLIDFGLCRTRRCDLLRDIDRNTVFGTPLYMSPEHIAGDISVMTPPSDVYSLGVILFQLLTGRLPYDLPPEHEGSLSAIGIYDLILNEKPPFPSLLVDGLPPALEAICMKCLKKEGYLRYRDGGDLAADLGRFGRGEKVHAPAPGFLELLLASPDKRLVLATAAACGIILVLLAILLR